MVLISDQDIHAIRKFNRYYTNVLGLLNQHIYDSPFSLTEVRILFEIHNTNNCTATILQEELGLDRGYVSRIIKRFEEQNMIEKQKCAEDGRSYILHLTEQGSAIFRDLERKANQQIEHFLSDMNKQNKEILITSMQTIERLLMEQTESTIIIREGSATDDINTVVEKQRLLYADSYGFDNSFADYLHHTIDTPIERIWIAEVNGQFAGCAGLVKENEETAQFRWFMVETQFRGRGIGKTLMQAVIDYCREQNMQRIFLWTVSMLTEARQLYGKFGFTLSERKAEQLLWGQKLSEERWDLELL
ncbi:MAG TPA: bifunctional helix-turn-helix transcriptional regulator/GNAT family N-acetyltransferase [Dictyobacter sp.]|jgi:DNA-binding MarR family transcriptional regulator/N-acetylglutamate synthase-like GNAT family acetyltransferase|nr:bifunctional helix-turn-helix transcriptional regulator/GNAT family N-acetyltransferase [Dictyobacter sp.]